MHYTYRLTVRGTGSDAVRGREGDAMDGAGDGKSGSDYNTTITAANLVIVGKHSWARKVLAGLLAKENRLLAKNQLTRSMLVPGAPYLSASVPR